MKATPGTPKFDFVSNLVEIAEDKFGANFSLDEAESWIETIFAEYKTAGTPKDQRKWLVDRLKSEFKSMQKPPAWVDKDSSSWPFHKSRPMVFIAQIPLKASGTIAEQIHDGWVTYLFGIADKADHNEDIMVYREVTLVPD